MKARQWLKPAAAELGGTPTRKPRQGTRWKQARSAATEAANAYELHQERLDAAVAIQFQWRRKRNIEKLRRVLRIVVLLVRHSRMERAAAGEPVDGMSAATLAESRAAAVATAAGAYTRSHFR